MQCPSSECQKNMEGMRKTLYGPDGKSGITACLQHKVSWKQLGSIATVLVMVLVGMIYRNLDAAQNAMKERANNAKQIEVVLKVLEHLTDSNLELKNGQKEIRREVRELKEKSMTPELFQKFLSGIP